MQHFLKPFVLILVVLTSFYSVAQDKTLSAAEADTIPGMDTLEAHPEAMVKFNMGISYFEKGDFEQAINWFDQAITIDSKFSKAYINKAASHSKLNQSEKVIDTYKAAITNTEDAHVAHYFLGKVLVENGDYETGVTHLNNAIEIKPQPNYYYHLGVAQFQLKKYLEAIQSFSDCIKLDNKNAFAYHDRGSAKKMLENYDGAAEDYKKAIFLDNDLAMAYNNLASVYRQEKNYVLAIAEYTNAINRESDNVVLYNNRGKAYYDKGEYDKAIEDFTKAISLDAKYSFAYNNRAGALIKQEKWKEAIADCSKALEVNPELANAYINRGIAKEMSRDEEGACADWTEAFSLGSVSAESYLNSSVCNQ